MSETYRVLARKYRPQTFADLVGQDVLVRTLSNAIRTGRIAHAYLLTGIRGVGKTTTARIIARALNCTGPDGQGGPTSEPCGVCSNCIQIAADRHVDVIEMDAASRTGVDNMRDLIETVAYAPAQGRYKIYIIDEVHMLSVQAFNALLKTLEEPPAHVVFVFATTELRKIPVTILSRCMCFDLRRLDADLLRDHLKNIAGKENVTADDDALQLLAIAAEGSVRDSLSLLDQAIAHSSHGEGAVHVDTATVRAMLGLADRTRVFNLLETLLEGKIQESLSELRAQYDSGADLNMVFQDMLQLMHLTMRLVVDPKINLGPGYAEGEVALARKLAAQTDIPVLSRAWQILNKGLEELKRAGDLLMSAEMALIRLAYTSTLPTPADIFKESGGGETPPDKPVSRTTTTGGNGGGSYAGTAAYSGSSSSGAPVAVLSMPEPVAQAEVYAAPVTPHLSLAANNPAAEVHTLEEMLALAERSREPAIYHFLFNHASVIEMKIGVLRISETPETTPEALKRVSQWLSRATDMGWQVTAAKEPGEPTLYERREAAKAAELKAAHEHANVAAIFELFPGAELVEITDTEGEKK